jgi:hypothetical protein
VQAGLTFTLAPTRASRKLIRFVSFCAASS